MAICFLIDAAHRSEHVLAKGVGYTFIIIEHERARFEHVRERI